MIKFLLFLGKLSFVVILMMIAACILYIIGFVFWKIAKRITEGIEKGMNDR